MHTHRKTRLVLALTTLLAFDAAGAAAPTSATEDNPAAQAAAVTAPAGQPEPPSTTKLAPAPGTPPIGSPAQKEQQAGPESHKAPAAVAAHAEVATPKEQAAIAAAVSRPGDPSGFRLMTLSTNALLSRVSLADQAKKTIDLQYFIFKNDATGRLIALHLLQAAERGVKVRILIDDLNLKDETPMFAALASNPNIQVRLFNPFHGGDPGALSRTAQLMLDFRRLNRRMHNKSYIVDNDVAVIGGRNIADEYFDAHVDNNFRDLDVLAIGPVVPQATRTFESYWNSDAAHPLGEFKQSKDPAGDLARERAELEKDARKFDQSAYTSAAADDLPNGASADRPGNWYWGPATLVADDPAKIEAGAERSDLRINPEIKNLIKNAQSEVLLITPYFVPSAADEQNFVSDAQRGVKFEVLTNSLASTDEIAVHEGYASHRRALLKGGVQLYELQPTPGVEMAATDAGQSSGVSLHAKSFVVDERYVFIGSMNMDERSKLLNTEMGVVVDSPQLAKAVSGFFQTATLPANAYHVVLGGADGSGASGLHWEATKNGKPVEYSSDPDTSVARRAKVQVLKLLPIDGLL